MQPYQNTTGLGLMESAISTVIQISQNTQTVLFDSAKPHIKGDVIHLPPITTTEPVSQNKYHLILGYASHIAARRAFSIHPPEPWINAKLSELPLPKTMTPQIRAEIYSSLWNSLESLCVEKKSVSRLPGLLKHFAVSHTVYISKILNLPTPSDIGAIFTMAYATLCEIAGEWTPGTSCQTYFDEILTPFPELREILIRNTPQINILKNDRNPQIFNLLSEFLTWMKEQLENNNAPPEKEENPGEKGCAENEGKDKSPDPENSPEQEPSEEENKPEEQEKTENQTDPEQDENKTAAEETQNESQNNEKSENITDNIDCDENDKKEENKSEEEVNSDDENEIEKEELTSEDSSSEDISEEKQSDEKESDQKEAEEIISKTPTSVHPSMEDTLSEKIEENETKSSQPMSQATQQINRVIHQTIVVDCLAIDYKSRILAITRTPSSLTIQPEHSPSYDRLRKLLRSRVETKNRRRVESGRIDLRNTLDIAFGTGNIFTNIQKRTKLSASIFVLLDLSSSTIPTTLPTIMKAAKDISSITRWDKNIRMSILGYTSYSVKAAKKDERPEIHNLLYKFGGFNHSLDRKQEAIQSFCASFYTGGTPTGSAIIHATAALLQEQSDLRILLVLTDGLANDPAIVKTSLEAAHASGIKTCVITIGTKISQKTDKYDAIYKASTHVDVPDALDRALTDAIMNKI